MEKIDIIKRLDEMNIEYKLVNHKPLFTMNDNYDIGVKLTDCKNLLMKDKKSEQFFLVVVDGFKRVDMKKLQKDLNVSKLSFANDEELYDKLRITKGSVSPFCMLNNEDKSVKLIVDNDLAKATDLGVHPNDNTATVILDFNDLLKFLNIGDRVSYIEI